MKERESNRRRDRQTDTEESTEINEGEFELKNK